jgi:oligopeptide/dipeptide ABC transporter ATP-binding protein
MTGNAGDPVFTVRDLVKVFGRGRTGHRAVDGVSFEVRRGETLGVVGESGSGKTTVGRILVGFERSTSGEVMFEGRPLAGLTRRERMAFRRTVQMVFQNPFASLNPLRTVRSALSDGIARSGIPRHDRERAMAELMQQVGLTESMLDRYPHEFSGGQRQRLVLARALTVSPQVLIADEPVSALDVSIQAQVLNLLNDLKAELGLTIVFVTHDLRVVNFFSDRIAVMYRGRLVELGTREQIMDESRHPYTRMLLSAAPHTEPGHDAARPWVRQDASAGAPPATGCNFASRCWVRAALGHPERCAAEPPPLRAGADDGHLVACHFEAQVPTLAGAPATPEAR